MRVASKQMKKDKIFKEENVSIRKMIMVEARRRNLF